MINLLSLGRVTSEYGYRNIDVPNASKNHKGIDIVLSNPSIPSVVAGTVVENSYSNARGYYITVKDSNGYKQRYQHMKSKSPLTIGTKVKEGSVLGTMGNTGVSGGAHLHFEVMKPNGEYINPRTWLKGADGSPSYSTNESNGTTNTTSDSNSTDLKWWGDVVKVVLAGLLVIGGVVMLVLGVKDVALK